MNSSAKGISNYPPLDAATQYHQIKVMIALSFLLIAISHHAATLVKIKSLFKTTNAAILAHSGTLPANTPTSSIIQSQNKWKALIILSFTSVKWKTTQP